MATTLPGIIQYGLVGYTSSSYCAQYLIAFVQEPDGAGQTKIYAEVYALLSRGWDDDITLLDRVTEAQRTYSNMYVHLFTPSGINGGTGIDLSLPDGVLPNTEGLHYMGKTESYTFSTSSLSYSVSNIGDWIDDTNRNVYFGGNTPTGALKPPTSTSPNKVFSSLGFSFYDFDKIQLFLDESGYSVDWTDDGLESGTVKISTTYSNSPSVPRYNEITNGAQSKLMFTSSNLLPELDADLQTKYPGYGINNSIVTIASASPQIMCDYPLQNTHYTITSPLASRDLSDFLTLSHTAINVAFSPLTAALNMNPTSKGFTCHIFVPITNTPETPYYHTLTGSYLRPGGMNMTPQVYHLSDDSVSSGHKCMLYLYSGAYFALYYTPSGNAPSTSTSYMTRWTTSFLYNLATFPEYQKSTFLMARVSFDGGDTWTNWADQSGGDYRRQRELFYRCSVLPGGSNNKSYMYLIDENGDYVYLPMNTDIDVKIQYKLVNTSTELGGETSVCEFSYTYIPYVAPSADFTDMKISEEGVSYHLDYSLGTNAAPASTNVYVVSGLVGAYSDPPKNTLYSSSQYTGTGSYMPYGTAVNRDESYDTVFSSGTNNLWKKQPWNSDNTPGARLPGGAFMSLFVRVQRLDDSFGYYQDIYYRDPIYADLDGVGLRTSLYQLNDAALSTVTPPAKLDTWEVSSFSPQNGTFLATLLATLRIDFMKIYSDGYPGNIYNSAHGFGPFRTVISYSGNILYPVGVTTDYFKNEFSLQSHLEIRYSLDNGTTWTDWTSAGQTEGTGYTITSTIEDLPAGAHVVLQGRQYWREGSWFSPIDEIEFDTPPLPPDVSYTSQELSCQSLSQKITIYYEQNAAVSADATVESQWRFSINGGENWHNDWTTFATGSGQGQVVLGSDIITSDVSGLIPAGSNVLLQFRTKKTDTNDNSVYSDIAELELITDDLPEDAVKVELEYDELNREQLTIKISTIWEPQPASDSARPSLWMITWNLLTDGGSAYYENYPAPYELRVGLTPAVADDSGVALGHTTIDGLNIHPNDELTLDISGIAHYNNLEYMPLPRQEVHFTLPRPILGITIDENGGQKYITDIATTDPNEALSPNKLDVSYKRFHLPE